MSGNSVSFIRVIGYTGPVRPPSRATKLPSMLLPSHARAEVATPDVGLHTFVVDQPGSETGQHAAASSCLAGQAPQLLEGPPAHLEVLTGPARRARSASKLPSMLLPAAVRASSNSPWWLNTVWGWDCTM